MKSLTELAGRGPSLKRRCKGKYFTEAAAFILLYTSFYASGRYISVEEVGLCLILYGSIR